MGRPPPGIRLLNDVTNSRWKLSTYRTLVLVLTFMAYACYHASRKPTSIVKSVLDPEPVVDGGIQSSSARDDQFVPWPAGPFFVRRKGPTGNFTSAADRSARSRGLQSGGWAPFNGEDGTAKLGEIDLAFLLFYSAGMYVAGHLGDTLDLRLFLAIGMVGSGLFVMFFGMGYFWNVHSFLYYMLMQMAAGLFQATGWPSVVAVIGNWFGKRKRGLIMGVWNAHTSVGNITGSLLAACVLQYGWGWSFILPGALIFCGGIIVYLFLAAYPEDVELACPTLCNSENEKEIYAKDLEGQVHARAVKKSKADPEAKEERVSAMNRSSAVGVSQACLIPGVVPFAMCLFFSKLVAYTFLYWLPFYLSQTAIGGEYISVKSAGNLSTLFDVGGIVGGILAGHVSDRLGARAVTAASFMYLAIPSLLLYRAYGDASRFLNIVLMMIAGLFVNGPYALITTAVSADLGTHSSLKGNSRALATVTAIIDGTGSVGAALGPLLTGFLSRRGWNAVFSMLIFGAFVAGLLLSRLVMTEITELFTKTGHEENLSQQGNQGSTSEPLLREQR
ncbi:unnamed protein product [Victoria cruziana]